MTETLAHVIAWLLTYGFAALCYIGAGAVIVVAAKWLRGGK